LKRWPIGDVVDPKKARAIKFRAYGQAQDRMEEDFDFGETIPGMKSGSTVFGRYKLDRILGRGAMGVVWLASDTTLERQVALKFLPEVVRLDESSFEDLSRRTKRCLDLTHPNIVRIHDIVHDERSADRHGVYPGQVVGGHAPERPNGVFEVEEGGADSFQLADALRYVHEEAMVVHRDLKPVRSSCPKMAWSSCRFRNLAQHQRFGKPGQHPVCTSGTLAYMSPQQAYGQAPSISDESIPWGRCSTNFSLRVRPSSAESFWPK